MLKKAIVGGVVLGGGFGVASLIVYRARLKGNSAISATDYHKKQQNLIDEILKSPPEKIKNLDMTLYRYTTCPFCAKLQTFLDYHNLKYDIVEVNPLTKKEIKGNEYPKVPQLKLGENGPIVVDSDAIVGMLDPVLDQNQSNRDVEDQEKWRTWAREKLVRYMVLNTNRTLSEANLGYKYVDNIPTFSSFDRLTLKALGGMIMYLVANNVTNKKLQTLGYDGKDPRAALYTEVNSWVGDGVKDRDFHGGNRPDLADFDVYGIISSQKFLPVYQDLLDNANPHFSAWVRNMDNVVAKKL